jgi:hypothetical protein
MKKTTKRPTKKSSKKKFSTPNRLEKATALYYASLSPEDRAHENRLGAAMASASTQLDINSDN